MDLDIPKQMHMICIYTCICICICLHAPFWLQCLGKNPFWELVPGKMNIVILELRSKQALFWKWLPRPNHYAHDVRNEILCRTLVSILKYLSPQPQNLRKNSHYCFLAWTSTWVSKWRRWRRRRPNNSGHLAEPWSNVPRNQISRSGNPSLGL